MKGITTWIVLGSLLLSGCDQKSVHMEASSEPLTDISTPPAFACQHETFPAPSADEGNPQAQAYVGDKLAPVDRAPDIARQMRRCAAEQGEGKAAVMLGVNLQGGGHYRRAIEAFQMGIAAGDESSASFLEHGFSGPEFTDELYYLAQQKDPERARRYEQIGDVLGRYSYASPTVPEINDIVPLPPALIEKLAKAKQLNPATGRPLPTSPDSGKYNRSAGQ